MIKYIAHDTYVALMYTQYGISVLINAIIDSFITPGYIKYVGFMCDSRNFADNSIHQMLLCT